MALVLVKSHQFLSLLFSLLFDFRQILCDAGSQLVNTLAGTVD